MCAHQDAKIFYMFININKAMSMFLHQCANITDINISSTKKVKLLAKIASSSEDVSNVFFEIGLTVFGQMCFLLASSCILFIKRVLCSYTSLSERWMILLTCQYWAKICFLNWSSSYEQSFSCVVGAKFAFSLKHKYY